MMKFITEEYLRDIYRKQTFDTYTLQQGQRLTPGAVQYLSDKKIELIDDASKANKKVSKNDQPEVIEQKGNDNLNLKKKLCCKLRSVEAKFLVTSSEILEEDIILAQNITNLGRKISKIRNAIDGKGTIETIEKSDRNNENLLTSIVEIEEYFEITEFHMQLKNSSTILKMHTLRCNLVELQFEILETYENEEEALKISITNSLNLVINSLSQLIESAVGGKECQIRN